MTKTIEFVEQNIFECEKHIQYLNSKINEDKKYPSLVKSHKERIGELKPILQNLEQIKCELEAWEVVKKHCDYQDGEPFDCIPEGFYIIEPIRGKDFLIVRKALGEENE